MQLLNREWFWRGLIFLLLVSATSMSFAATCVQADGSGVLSVMAPQPADFSTCTLVVVAGTEVAASPFAMTIEQGQQIGMAIMLACAVAWGFRLLARAINVDYLERE